MDPHSSLNARRGRGVAWGWALLALAIASTGCNDIQKQKSRAMTASRHFQSLYNTGSCRQIYDDASAYFQSRETRPRWLKDCDEVRKRFGSWLEFTPTLNNAWPIGPIGIVWVRGSARFANGVAEVRLDWDLTHDRAALFNVLIEDGGEEVSIPGFTGAVRD